MKRENLFLFILMTGVFGILNTEVGMIGILPEMAANFNISVSEAGLLVSLFALVISFSGPTMPLLASGINRRTVMLLVLGIFTLSNVAMIFASSFAIALVARVIPAIFHPVYCSLALTEAGRAVAPDKAPQAVSKVLMGVSAGTVIGIPVASLLASSVSLTAALAFFGLVDAIAFLMTLAFVPPMPVKQRMSYGSQLRVLKKSITWLSITAIVFLCASMFVVYAYIAEYLQQAAHVEGAVLSFLLFLFGISSIFGNYLAGKLLAHHAVRCATIFPFVMSAVYIMMFFFAQFTIPFYILIVVWGILYGIGNNIQQYWVASAIPEAPDFANGLFLAFGNLGTTIGTSAGGLIIASTDISYILLGAVVFLALNFLFVLLRRNTFSKEMIENIIEA